MMKRLGTLLGVGLMLTAPICAEAAAPRLAGFGTLSLSCFSSETADYALNQQPEGPGATRDCDAGLDSILGVQFDFDLADRLDFGLQFAYERQAEAALEPVVSLAQMRWRVDPDTTIRAGRMATASFLHTENRKVRYAQPWVRPPMEVYGLVPTYAQDGVEWIHASKLGDWHVEWHGMLARSHFESQVAESSDATRIRTRQAGLYVTMNRESLQYKVSYGQSRMTAHNPGLDGLMALLPADQRTDLEIDDTPVRLLGLSRQEERGDWLFVTEAGYRTSGGYLREQLGVYATLAHHAGPWTPYATLARRWTRGPDSDSRTPAYLTSAVNDLLAATRYDNATISVGVARDLGEQATLKLQADRVMPRGRGQYVGHTPDYNYAGPGKDWLLSLSLDFVF